MKENPLISVIIPVYNPGIHLYKCIDSIVNQTYRNLEIILIDDGSTDGSGKVCDEYAEKDSRIICIHKENAGVSKARNAGLEIATGDYYYFPDSDDYIDLDSFEYLLGIIDQYHCDAAVFEHYVTYSDHEEAHHLPKEYYGLYEGGKEIIKIYFRVAFACNKLFSKKLITGSNSLPGIKFDETIARGEDGLFSRTALDRADRVYFTNRPLYHYVQSEQSACRGAFRTSQLTLLKMIDIDYEWFSKKYPDYLPRLYANALESYIMLYYDMWADEKSYAQERGKMYSRFEREYKEHRGVMTLSKKQKIKFSIFKISPVVFCKLHKIYNRK